MTAAQVFGLLMFAGTVAYIAWTIVNDGNVEQVETHEQRKAREAWEAKRAAKAELRADMARRSAHWDKFPNCKPPF